MLSEWVIFTDGGSRGNPGLAACAFVVQQNQELMFQQGKFLGQKTNNEAEYQGVIESLLWLRQQQEQPVAISWKLDSKLVVEQINGNWKIKEPRLQMLQQQCLKLLNQILPSSNYSFTHVPRNQNALADALVNQVLDQQ